MRTISCLLKTAFYLILAIPLRRRIQRLLAQGNEAEARPLIREKVEEWSTSMLRFAGVTVDIYGEENRPTEPVLYAPNHQSNWDIMLSLAHLEQCGLLSKEEIGKIPLIRPWMDFLHVEYINRKDPRQFVKALKLCEGHLTDHESFIVFPEGTRSKGEELGEFKAGALRIAAKHGIPIVPVSIDGSYKIMEANGGRIRPGHVIITIQPQITTEEMDKAAMKSLSETVRQSVLEGRETGRRLYSEQLKKNSEAAQA